MEQARLPLLTPAQHIAVLAYRVEIKELKLRPATDVHDYQVRLRSAAKFLEKVLDTCAIHRGHSNVSHHLDYGPELRGGDASAGQQGQVDMSIPWS